MKLFRTISKPRTLTADIPARWKDYVNFITHPSFSLTTNFFVLSGVAFEFSFFHWLCFIWMEIIVGQIWT